MIRAIKNGLKDTGFDIKKPIEFDLAIMNVSEGSGGLKIYVAKAEGKFKSEEINHIKFEVVPTLESSRNITTFPPKNKTNPAR